jgi:hypothetical protein
MSEIGIFPQLPEKGKRKGHRRIRQQRNNARRSNAF